MLIGDREAIIQLKINAIIEKCRKYDIMKIYIEISVGLGTLGRRERRTA
ncbi:MAG: hypothetical protein K2H41_14450 [Acetatifactor sp.]|nr:hypothetical protein [Acetatifactor sp.]